MKIKGKKVEGINETVIVIPRYNSEDIVFLAKAILDFDHFHNTVKQPTPHNIIKDGKQIPNLKDEGFRTKTKKYRAYLYDYIVYNSLLATDGLEWETVDDNDPETWTNWEKELHDSGFTRGEINYIFEKVFDVNSLNQERLDEARESFLQMQEALNVE